MELLLLIPQRILIPGLLLSFSLITSLVTLSHDIPASLTKIETNKQNEVVQLATRLQGTLNNLLQKNDLSSIQAEISHLGSDMSIQNAMVISDQNSIISATQFNLLKNNIATVLTAKEIQLFNAVRQSYSGITNISLDKQHIIAIYPLIIGTNEQEIRPLKTGILYIQYALEDLKQAEIELLLKNTLQHTIAICAAAALLWLIFRATLTNRVEHLVNTTKQVAAGNFDSRINMTGGDEIAEIAQAFDSMTIALANERAKLSRSEKRLRAIIENVVDGILTIDRNGLINAFNPAAEKIFLYNTNDIIGKNINTIIPGLYYPDNPACFAWQPATPDLDSTHHSHESEGLRQNGETFPVEVSITEMKLDDELMFVAIIRDMTERNKIDRIKHDFVSTVNHELRTPLTSIKGSLTILSSEMLCNIPAQAREVLDIATRNSQRLAKLIDDILDIERIESGKITFNRKPVHIKNIIDDSIKSNIGYAREHATQFVVTEIAKDAVIFADADRLIQVMSNLLSNAAKFSPAESTVEISVIYEKSKVRINILDHGYGIPQSFRASIFEKFARADSSDNRKAGGTGLGLAISKKIIDMHGGIIGFEPNQNGTCFYFELPEYNARHIQKPA